VGPVQASCKTLLDHLHHHRGIAHFRFGDEQMKVLGHEDISVNHKAVLAAGLLQDSQEKVAAFSAAQLGLTAVAIAGDKMQVLGTIVAMQSFRHPIRVNPRVQA
jgi:hypothetical protein